MAGRRTGGRRRESRGMEGTGRDEREGGGMGWKSWRSGPMAGFDAPVRTTDEDISMQIELRSESTELSVQPRYHS